MCFGGWGMETEERSLSNQFRPFTLLRLEIPTVFHYRNNLLFLSSISCKRRMNPCLIPKSSSWAPPPPTTRQHTLVPVTIVPWTSHPVTPTMLVMNHLTPSPQLTGYFLKVGLCLIHRFILRTWHTYWLVYIFVEECIKIPLFIEHLEEKMSSLINWIV